MSNLRYDQFPAGVYDITKIFLQADPVTGALEKINLPSPGVWGSITGTLASQTDLATALAGKEPTITAGTILQYWRGNKTFATLNTLAVPELTNLYFTDARARAAISLTTTGTSGASSYNSGTGVLNVPNYASSSQWITTGSDIYYNTGKVGIGITAPLVQLNIQTATTKSTKVSALRIFNPGAGAGTGVRIALGYANADASGGAITGYFGSTNAIGIEVGGTERVTVTPAGVDITSSNGAAATLVLRNTNTNPVNGIQFSTGGGTWFLGSPNNQSLMFHAGSAASMFWKGDFLGTGNTFKQPNNTASQVVAAFQASTTQSGNIVTFNDQALAVLSCIGPTGSINAGDTVETTCAIIKGTSTTKGLLLPRMTTTQKNAIASPVNGLLVYDTTLGKACVYTTAWETITSV